MNRQRKSIIFGLSLVLMLGAILTASVACIEYTCDLVIENQTEDVLTIYRNDYLIGDVEPGEQITKEVPRDIGDHLIVAKNAQGEIVYSKKYTPRDLEEADYKVVIPPVADK